MTDAQRTVLFDISKKLSESAKFGLLGELLYQYCYGLWDVGLSGTGWEVSVKYPKNAIKMAYRREFTETSHVTLRLTVLRNGKLADITVGCGHCDVHCRCGNVREVLPVHHDHGKRCSACERG